MPPPPPPITPKRTDHSGHVGPAGSALHGPPEDGSRRRDRRLGQGEAAVRPCSGISSTGTLGRSASPPDGTIINPRQNVGRLSECGSHLSQLGHRIHVPRRPCFSLGIRSRVLAIPSG